MAYDATLPDNQNWVRFLIGDTTASPILSDDEIDAILTEIALTVSGQGVKYLAAALALDGLAAEWRAVAKGITEKQVENLRIKRGIDASVEDAMRARAAELRKLGAFYAASSPRVLKVI